MVHESMHDIKRNGPVLPDFLAHPVEASSGKVFKPSGVGVTLVEKVLGSVTAD
jgi:hypothetical protein